MIIHGNLAHDDVDGLPETIYYYRVKACNVAGCSDFSAYDSGYRVSDPPSVPTSVSATDGRYTAFVEVVWSSSGWADDYEVYRCTSTAIQDCGTAITTTQETLYEDKGALPATIYHYRVKACNVAGCSDASSEDAGYRVSDAPAAPATVTASDGTYTDTVQVSWSNVPWVALYEVFRCTSTAKADCGTAITVTSDLSYADDDAAAGTMYHYRVKANNAAGSSDYSGEDAGYRVSDAPAAPDTINASDGAYTDTVQVSWQVCPGQTITRCTGIPKPPFNPTTR